MKRKAYCFFRNGAGIKTHDKIEDARAQALRMALWDTALGLDVLHPELPNTATYKVETLLWNGDRYVTTDIEKLNVERDRDVARKALNL
jgi:valyl-tRNA synthetase